MMILPYDLDEVRRRPSMYLPNASFDVSVAYLMGIDAGRHGEFLKGFHEWLVPIVKYGNNLAWSELVLRITFPEAEDPRSQLLQCSDQRHVLDSLFLCLENFLAEKEKDQGFRTIITRYEDWLRGQDWFRPSLLDS